MAKKTRLKNLDFVNIRLPQDTILYANLNSCPAFSTVDYYWMNLKRENKLTSHTISRSYINIKFDDNYHKVSHVNEIASLFPHETFI